MKTTGNIILAITLSIGLYGRLIVNNVNCANSNALTLMELTQASISNAPPSLISNNLNNTQNNTNELEELLKNYLIESKKNKNIVITNEGSNYINELPENKNLLPPSQNKNTNLVVNLQKWKEQLEFGRSLRHRGDTKNSALALIDILESIEAPESVKKDALFELALVAQQENKLLRANQIYAHYLSLFPDDARTPEILLRQGLILREMGASTMALSKFYAVLSRALSLKLDQFPYYQRIVLQAQAEIADTYFLLGKYEEAAEFFQRLLRLDNPDLNRAHVQFKLIQCLSFLGRHESVVAQGRDFLSRYKDSADEPEVRFRLALALKALGRNSEALREALILLQSQMSVANQDPEKWKYWQQRVGNEIANQLYKEGDYLNALEVYKSLAQLDSSLNWQLPVMYQIGLTYEKLKQPTKACEIYNNILSKATELSTNTPTSIQIVFDMAKYRREFIQWLTNIESTVMTTRLTTSWSTNNPAETKQ